MSLSNTNQTDSVNEVRYAIVNTIDGDILRIGSCSTASLVLQVEKDCLTIHPAPDGVGDLTHYWNGESFVLYPEPQPSRHHRWVNGAWVDLRTEADKEAETITNLHSSRGIASLPKLEFVLRVVTRGYLSRESGLGLLEGKVPPELSGMPELMNESQMFELQAKLMAATKVDRLDPFIQMTALYLNMSDAEVDDLFDVILTENE